MADGKIATLVDMKRNVLAVYIKRTGFFKQTARLSRLIKRLESEVESCIRDFIVVHDDDEIIVIVDTNQPKRDERAFYKLVELTRKTLSEGGATYQEVEYPTDLLYDPRRIWDSPNYGGFEVKKKKKIIRW